MGIRVRGFSSGDGNEVIHIKVRHTHVNVWIKSFTLKYPGNSKHFTKKVNYILSVESDSVYINSHCKIPMNYKVMI